MRRALLDVNVLLALLDREHIKHDRAVEWMHTEGGPEWASCAITQNGFIRIVSQPRYPQPVTPAAAMARLERACAELRHEFWPCDITLLNAAEIDRRALLGTKQVTDAYLLALAVSRGGRLVSFDTSLPLSAVVGATEEHRLVL